MISRSNKNMKQCKYGIRLKHIFLGDWHDWGVFLTANGRTSNIKIYCQIPTQGLSRQVRPLCCDPRKSGSVRKASLGKSTDVFFGSLLSYVLFPICLEFFFPALVVSVIYSEVSGVFSRVFRVYPGVCFVSVGQNKRWLAVAGGQNLEIGCLLLRWKLPLY